MNFEQLCFVLAGVMCLVMADQSNSTEEWITWSRMLGRIVYHESVLINNPEQTILMVAGEADRINYDNTLSLHDFIMGYVAIKDFRTSECFLSNVRVSSFEEARDRMLARQGQVLPKQPTDDAIARPISLEDIDIGEKITEFCHNLPCYWFEAAEESHEGHRARRSPRFGGRGDVRTTCIVRDTRIRKYPRRF